MNDAYGRKSFKQVKEDTLREIEYDETRENPTPLQLLALEGVKHLTAKQREIWEYTKFEKMTHQEIADKLGISRPVVSKHLKAAAKRMTKWFMQAKVMSDIMRGDNG